MNYKIEIQNQEQADEAEKMAATLGYEMDTMFSEKWSDKYCYLLLCKDMSAGFGCEKMTEGDKPMAFDELRDLVVLKRNSIDDATHILENGLKLYKDSKGNFFKMYRRFENDLARWVELDYASDSAKPIEKPMKEYLLKTEDGTYHYHNESHDKCPKYLEKIEIPEGAEVATVRNGDIVFWKDGKHMAGELTLPDCLRYLQPVSIIWQRHTRPEELPFIDDESKEICKDKHSPTGEMLREWANTPVGSCQTVQSDAKPNQTTINAMNEADALFTDAVNHPSHYASSSIECIDAMEAMLTPEQFIGYLRGNVAKYLWRYDKKNGKEDLSKAIWYLNKLNNMY